MRGDGRQLVEGAADEDVEVGLHEQLPFLRYELEHLLDVRLGYLVRRVGHGAVALRLALQLAEQPPLLRYLHHLVVDDAVGVGHRAEEREHVGGDSVPVDLRGLVGLQVGRQVDHVDVHEVHRLQHPVAQVEILVAAPEVAHRERPFPELEGHEAVQVLVHLLAVQLAVADAALCKDVRHLPHLDVEVEPQFGVVLDERAAHRLLRDDEVGLYFRILPPFKVFEVGLREERRVGRQVMMVALPAEDVLLLQRVPLAECLHDVVQHIGVGGVLLRVGAVLQYRVLHLYDDGAVSTVGEEHRVEVTALPVAHVLELGEEAVHGSFRAVRPHPCLLSFSVTEEVTVDEDALAALLGVESAALLDVDGQQPGEGDGHHGGEPHYLAHEDGEDDEPHEGEADGPCGIGEESPPDAHELQRFLESLEYWIIRFCGFHGLRFHRGG